MGVLSGIRVLEFEAIGPGPFGTMLLANMGADVIRIDRPTPPSDLGPKTTGPRIDVTGRGRRSVTLDLKQPEAALARNPKLVYGRMTGWGQTGPLADRAGHDLACPSAVPASRCPMSQRSSTSSRAKRK